MILFCSLNLKNFVHAKLQSHCLCLKSLESIRYELSNLHPIHQRMSLTAGSGLTVRVLCDKRGKIATAVSLIRLIRFQSNLNPTDFSQSYTISALQRADCIQDSMRIHSLRLRNRGRTVVLKFQQTEITSVILTRC